MPIKTKSHKRKKNGIRQNNVDRCTSYVLQKIESGELGAGSRLGEPSLAREIGVDRGTVRVVFERLSATGILERVPRSGTYLKKMSLDDIRSANQVRCQLEVLGVRLAALHATTAEVNQLMKTAKLADELTASYAGGKKDIWFSVRSLEIEYHTMIARASHNPYLLSMMSRDSFLQVCFPFLMISSSIREESLRDYWKDTVTNLHVAEAILGRDPEVAGEVMTRHVEGALTIYERGVSERENYSDQKVEKSTKGQS